MTGQGLDLPASPLPPPVPESAGLPLEAPLDPVDVFVLGNLAEVRLFQIGEKRILRGRVTRGDEGRASLERRLRSLPVDHFFERVGEDTYATVSRPKSRAVPRGWPLNVLLFLATVLTTTWAGAYWGGIDPFVAAPGGGLQAGAVLAGLRAGVPFALSLLAILTCHEFGHYFAARRYGLDTTLPFYVPIPPFVSPIGTLGAVIKMKTPLYNRRILMDVGAAGPLAGLAVAIPILAWGILHAPVAPAASGPGVITFNEPLLFKALEKLLRPDLPAGSDIEATSLVLAGWLGLFVTALNLLPVGQLDGGHVTYALLGKGQHRVGMLCFVALAGLGFLWDGWWVWVVLILLLVRIRHPPVLDLELPLDRKRKAIGWLAVVLFLLCVHPVPFSIT